MNKFFCIIILISNISIAQVTLNADGPGNTYELINSVLANPGRDVLEVPDCSHTEFGRHIDEVFDNDLNKYVFRFHLHVTPDNDRCIPEITDRQRNEIKAFSGSPDNLKGIYGESVEYKWKFRISSDFQPSTRFTHIHQIKSVGDGVESSPLFTLTLRKANPDRFEIRYTPFDKQITLVQGDLSAFKGNWITVKQDITYSNEGKYSIEIRDESTNEVILNYKNDDIDTWQENADFARPKWGIYRSLIFAEDLKDEEVLFSDFSIKEYSTLPFYEGFDYNLGLKLIEDNASTGLGSWSTSAPRTSSDVVITNSPNWQFSNINESTGNAIQFKGSGVKPELLFTTQSGEFGKVYASFLASVTDASDINETPIRFIGFGRLSSSGSVSNATSVFIRSSGSNTYNIGVNESSSTSGIIWDNNIFIENQQLMLVFYFDDGTYESTSAKLWINPIINGLEPTPTLIGSEIRNQDVDRIQIYQHSNANTPEMIIDELRIGKTWQSVTKESTLNINTIENSNLKFSNLVNDYFEVSTNQIFLKELKVYNAVGQLVYDKSLNGFSAKLDFRNLKKGIYFLSLLTDKKSIRTKILKQ